MNIAAKGGRVSDQFHNFMVIWKVCDNYWNIFPHIFPLYQDTMQIYTPNLTSAEAGEPGTHNLTKLANLI